MNAFARLVAFTACIAACACLAVTYSWQGQPAKVLPTGDLEWAPQPFQYTPGNSIRYIDFEGGDDANAGTATTNAWKHHPWDPAATGNAKDASGVDTYVFKRGVIYRGEMKVPEGVAGTADTPIRLTSDPDWGTGEACIYGSEIVTGWEKGGHERMPDAAKVWHADLPYAPRAVWMVGSDGTITRLKLARTPNYTVSDPDDVHSEWWLWENPKWWVETEHKTNINGSARHLGIDTKNLTGKAEDYVGGLVWSEWGVVMGCPYATPIEGFDEEQHAIIFQGPWQNDSYIIHRNCRYSLEDLPNFLDEPGEFWFDKQNRGGRLYLRLPGDIDPSTVTVEAAARCNVIDATRMNHVEISGLTFRFNNLYWNLEFQAWGHPDVHNAAVRLVGAGNGISVKNCLFEHVSQAVRIEAATPPGLDAITVADNEVRFTDHGAIELGQGRRSEGQALGHVDVLRNNLYHIGFRPMRVNGHHALAVRFPETAEIAGNVLDRCGGAGLFLFGGKGSGGNDDVPFFRMLVHHNKVTDPLLIANDWGGIETWQGGPFYVYDNVSGNPGGLMFWGSGRGNKGTPRFGHAYYLDGSFKNYHFNNIAWGKNNTLGSIYANCAAFQEIISYQNTFFNNTVYKFVVASRRQAPQAGRDKFLGNIFDNISEQVFRHSDKEGVDPNARDAGAQTRDFAYETDAYADNIFYLVTNRVGVFEAEGGDYTNVAAFAAALKAKKALADNVGVVAAAPPLRDPGAHDFRLSEGSAAIDSGIVAFVPWSLYAVVGEWNFTRNNADPTVVIDEHWYMTPYYQGRDDYYTRPMYPLAAVGVTADDYVDGPLENWAAGALTLNGDDQYLVLSQEVLATPFTYAGRRGRRRGQDETSPSETSVSGAELKNPQIYTSSFLVEAYIKIDPGQDQGTIVAKMDEKAGYALTLNDAGGATLALKSADALATLRDGTVINDGEWHHVVAEADRANGKLAIYVDGQPTSSLEKEIPAGASLENTADLVACKGLACTVEFLRIAQGTLADAKTTIDELHTWQFNGPQFRDFAGRAPQGRRDAGALEYAE